MSSSTVNVTAKWQSNTITFPFLLSSTVADLHTHIALLLQLSPTLKLVGLTKGRLPDPTTTLSTLQLPADVKVLVVGTRAEDASELRAMDAAYSARRREEEAREVERQRQREVRQRMDEDIRREQERVAEDRRKAYEAERAERERKWAEEQERREQERREQELKAEQAGGNVTLTLSALLSPEADSKQKLILPPAALQSIVDAKVAFPLTFAVRKTGGATREEEEEKKDDKDSQAAVEVVHLGVADFNSPHSSVVLVPSSLLSSLQCTEGQSLTLSTVTLPKATHIILLPLPSSSTTPTGPTVVPSPFLSLSQPERTALLEFHLRRYQHLQRGQHITIRYRKHDPPMHFEVKDTQPADVVSIVDTDVETEVESVGELGNEEKANGTEHEGLVPVVVAEVVEAQLVKNQYWRGRVRLDDANGRYEVSVRSVKGDADLYVVRSERTNAAVDTTYWDWRGVEVGDDRIVLSSEEARWQPGEFDIAVHAYEADCAFKLTVTLLPPVTEATSSSSSSATASSSSSSATTADTKLCPNCHKPIPARSLAMHELQCRRNNSTCPDCHIVLLTRNLSKHRHTTHTPSTCPACHLTLPPSALAQHRRESCMGRLVECAYCPLLVTAEERGEHSAEDGLFSSACKECGEVMQRKVIRRHMRLQHGRNEREITWRDFF